MKLLVIGDFHGKFSNKIEKTIKKEKIDLILSPGDYSGNERLSKLFFKYYYHNDKYVPKRIEKEINFLDQKSIKDGLKIIKQLKKLNIPFIGIRGNWDPTPYPYDIGAEIRNTDKKHKSFEKLQTKQFNFIDFKLINLNKFIIIGGASSTSPGKINKSTLKKMQKNYTKKEIKQRLKEYNRRKNLYEKLFLKAKQLKKPIIFLTHNCPYNTKLDRVKKGPAKGKHYGSFLEKEIIKKFQPELVLCGHMHENQGKDKINKSTIINNGSILKNQFAIINGNENTKTINRIKFIK